MSVPATGRRVSVHEILDGRVEGGRIVEEWALLDLAGMDRRPALEGVSRAIGSAETPSSPRTGT